MKTTLDARRERMIRHILDARQLARDLDDQITDYVLEMALDEAMRSVSLKEASALDRLPVVE